MYIVTIVALVMAASLGWFAYRLLREERRRADARVAVLTAALERAEPAGWELPARRDPVVTSPAGSPRPGPLPDVAPEPHVSPAHVPELVFIDDDLRNSRAFRSEREEWVDATTPLRSEAVDGAPVHLRRTANDQSEAAPVRVGGLLADVPEARRGDARGLIAVVGLILVGLLALGYSWWSATPDAPAAAATAGAARQTTPASSAVPLELTALGHEQRRGVLVVRGVVRNPVAGSDRTGITANVTLLDAAGGVLGSGRAAVLVSVLRPGRDAEFSVELPARTEVRRYRVTFLAADGSLVAHADRRTRQP